MKPKLAALTLSLLVAFGLSGCYGYAVTVSSVGSDGGTDRDHNRHRVEERAPSYTPAPQSEPSSTYSPAPSVRERVPSNVPPPQPNPNPTPNQQPRVREQSPTTPPPKAPAPRTRPGNISYNAGSRSSASQRYRI